MSRDVELHRVVQLSLPGARLKLTTIADTGLQLWLLDADSINLAQASSALTESPPYWSIAWPAGVALAQLITRQPQWVNGKRVLDFGSGSGLVALAAACAGAVQVVACDIDPGARRACALNAEVNDCSLSVCAQVPTDAVWDLIVVTDVLYDVLNVPEVQSLVTRSPAALVADCRFRRAPGPDFTLWREMPGTMIPDFNDAQFASVSFWVRGCY